MNELSTLNNQLEKADHKSFQYLTFLVKKQLMAIALLDVKEIIEVSLMTRVPMSNVCIRGVTNLRGNVVPVIDLSLRLGGKATELSSQSCIVLVELEIDGAIQVFGLLVDEVNEILDIPEQNMQKTPDFGTEIRSDFIHKMGRINDQFIVLLKIDSVLSIKELSEKNQSAKKLN